MKVCLICCVMLFAICCFAVPCRAEDFTLQDLRDIVDQRESTIRTSYVKYRVVTTQLPSMAENAKVEAELAGLSTSPDLKPFVKPMEYEIRSSGERFAVAENRGTEDELLLAYDGEVLSRYEPRLRLGSKGPHSREDALGFLTTLTELSSPDESSPIGFSEAAIKQGATFTIESGKDVSVAVVMNQNVGGTLRTVAIINLSKGGWIERYETTLLNSPLLSNSEQLIEQCEVGGFIESGGVWIPKTIRFSRYGATRKQGASYACDLLLKRSVDVEAFSINEAIDDRVFSLEIPKGSRFVDEVSGATYVVQDDGAIKSLAEAIGHEIIAPGEYELNEAMQRVSSKQVNRIGWKTLLFGCLLGLTAIIAWFAARRRLK